MLFQVAQLFLSMFLWFYLQKKSFCCFLSAIKVAEANKDLRLYHTAMVGGGVSGT
jgi:hypothetical protein